jgi:hypothetical protein
LFVDESKSPAAPKGKIPGGLGLAMAEPFLPLISALFCRYGMCVDILEGGLNIEVSIPNVFER